MVSNEDSNLPYVNLLACCLSRIVREGYTEDFTVTDAGLESVQRQYNYKPGEIQIVNSFRFEGQSNPDNNVILYMIETADGTKGTLVDLFGDHNHTRLSRFMQNLGIEKKTVKN